MGDHTRPVTAFDGMMRIPLIWKHAGKIPAGRQVSRPLLRIDPRWDPLRDDPRFNRLLSAPAENQPVDLG